VIALFEDNYLYIVERFKVRHKITYKKVCGESKSVNENSNEINDWKNKLSNILKDYSPDQIYTTNFL
jgi:hypothetical protein